METIKLALDLGFTSVMFDGSKYPLDENIARTKEVVKLAKSYGADVEAEIGRVGGAEGDYKSVDVLVTSVEEAKRFAEESGIAMLPPRDVCHGQFVPKARRKLRNVPPAVNHTYRSMPLEGVHEMLGLIERAKHVLPQIKMPALILHSLNDRTADAESALYLREHLGSREKPLVWLKSSGHLIPVGEERDLVFESAAAFVSRTTQTAKGSGQTAARNG